MFGARFKGLSQFIKKQGNLIRIKTGLDTYLIRIQTCTPLSWYPPYSEKSGCPQNSCPQNLVLPPPPQRAQNEEKLYKFRQEKRAQRLTFWARRPVGGAGFFHAKGWGSKSSCPPLKVCLPWVLREVTWDVPGILPGCPGPLSETARRQ